MNEFDRAFEIVVGIEAGYSNDPQDSGGETKYGISKRSYPNEDIKNLTLDRAKELYHQDYWNPVHGDEIPWPLNLFLFDAAVNQGVEPSIRMLQAALSTIADGIIGPHTLQLATKADKRRLARFMAIRARRYVASDGFERYGTGWLTRLFLVMVMSLL